MYQNQDNRPIYEPLPPQEALPTMYDLPSENPEEPGLPDEFHLLQPELLRITFRPSTYPKDNFFTASDLNLYYDPRHPQWYKRPDWFAVLCVPRFYDESGMRLSFVTWQEGNAPFIVVELISPGTENEDLGNNLREINKPPNKWTVYEQMLRIPYYFVYNRYTNQLQCFGLVMNRYQPLPIDDLGVWLEEIQLGLGLWHGEYQGINRLWLRWYDQNHDWLPTPEEIQKQRADHETHRANAAESELARLKQILLERGLEIS